MSFTTMLRALSAHQVDYVIVGGVAAVLHGAPVSTFDVDIVHSRADTNVDRLLGALLDLESYYRERPDLRRAPDRDGLRGPGHHLLLTRAGPLDVLGTVVTGEGFDELRDQSRQVALGPDDTVWVLDLAGLIRIKEQLGRERDRAMLPILRRTLSERSG